MNDERMKIDCVEFGELLPDLDRPGTLGAERCEEALAHAEQCAPCATLMMEAEALNYDLRRISTDSRDLEAPARLETAVLADFRRAKAARPRRNWQRDVAILAIAALVLLAVALGLYRERTKIGGGAQTETANAVSTNSNGAQPAQVANADQSEVADNEYSSAFVPLPYADDISESQGGSVVRVDLPRESLVSMGVPVTGLNPGGHVVADLMLSEDGTPQAIRLVSQANQVQE
jgi:hypothetical protein